MYQDSQIMFSGLSGKKDFFYEYAEIGCEV